MNLNCFWMFFSHYVILLPAHPLSFLFHWLTSCDNLHFCFHITWLLFSTFLCFIHFMVSWSSFIHLSSSLVTLSSQHIFSILWSIIISDASFCSIIVHILKYGNFCLKSDSLWNVLHSFLLLNELSNYSLNYYSINWYFIVLIDEQYIY